MTNVYLLYDKEAGPQDSEEQPDRDKLSYCGRVKIVREPTSKDELIVPLEYELYMEADTNRTWAVLVEWKIMAAQGDQVPVCYLIDSVSGEQSMYMEHEVDDELEKTFGNDGYFINVSKPGCAVDIHICKRCRVLFASPMKRYKKDEEPDEDTAQEG